MNENRENAMAPAWLWQERTELIELVREMADALGEHGIADDNALVDRADNLLAKVKT